MDYRNGLKKRMALWVIAGSVGAGIPMLVPSLARAADEPKAVAEASVPAAVVSTAKSTYLEGQDVVYRRDGKQWDVNFTTPTNVRLQVTINDDGTIAKDVHLAPSQPNNAPKRDERERIAAAWQTRAAQVRATPVPGAPPPLPPVAQPGIPPALPPRAGDLPPIPVAGTNTPIGASDLPAAVLQSLDRFTAGGKDIRYYRQTSGTTNVIRYEADFTANDGSRREVVVADNGSLVAGPLVLRDTVEDKDLLADRPDNNAIPQPADTKRIEARDVPPRALAVMQHYVTDRASDVRYRRDTFADRSIGYTVHWVLADNGRRYWLTAREDGSLLVQPRLSSMQPGSTNDPEGVRSVAVRWADVPDRVKQTFQPLTGRDRNAQYFKQVRDGNKVFYGAQYVDNGRNMWIRVDESGKTVAGPVAADTGKPIGDAGREPVPAAGKIPPGTPLPPPAGREPELPKAVQTTINSHTQGGKNVVTTKSTEGGKTIYHVSWVDASGDKHQMRVDESGKQIVNAPAPKK